MRIKHIVMAALSLMLSTTVFAHGLMESPASRNWICGAVSKPDQVTNGTAQTPICGEAFAVNNIAGYSFMSVLTHALGRSSVTPLPTNVCSFGSETWQGAVTPWDMPIDWPTNPMTSGEQDITWNISWGPHFDDTAEFRYWITKSDFQFSKTKALTWDDFESTPFCVLNYEDSTPNANPKVVADKAAQKFHTTCTVPARTGHHVIYGEWGRKPPTLERFHGCVDGAFGGVVNPETVVAQISATPANLNVTGAGTITLSGAASQGTNLTYVWAVESANTSLYSLSSANTASTTLTLKNPQALTTFTVRLSVSNGSTSNSTSIAFTHSPTAASNWQDFGALTSSAKTLSVGDKVSVRLVNSAGVDTYFPASPLVITAATTAETAWPYALAQQVNATSTEVQLGVLNASDNVVPAQTSTTNRIYAKAPSTYVSAYLQVVGSSSSSAVSTSKSSSSTSSAASSASGQQCNWYGTLYPLCVTTASGWGWESNRNCIAASTCSAQPAPYGIVGTASSSVSTSAPVASTSSAVSTSSSVKTSSSTSTSVKTSSSTSTSVKTSSSTSSSVKTSSSSSVPTTSSSTATSSSVATTSSAASSAGSGGNCTYVVTNQWGNGFTAAIRIKNNRTTAINGWTVNWSYSDGSLVSSGWSATVTGSNPYSATNLAWNATIQPGQTVELGLQGTKTAASASIPVVTGSACN